jgi:hypothetical protein
LLGTFLSFDTCYLGVYLPSGHNVRSKIAGGGVPQMVSY